MWKQNKCPTDRAPERDGGHLHNIIWQSRPASSDSLLRKSMSWKMRFNLLSQNTFFFSFPVARNKTGEKKKRRWKMRSSEGSDGVLKMSATPPFACLPFLLIKLHTVSPGSQSFDFLISFVVEFCKILASAFFTWFPTLQTWTRQSSVLKLKRWRCEGAIKGNFNDTPYIYKILWILHWSYESHKPANHLWIAEICDSQLAILTLKQSFTKTTNRAIRFVHITIRVSLTVLFGFNTD